ncbi:hypothetical protein M514_17230, partial [Trichuris suis]
QSKFAVIVRLFINEDGRTVPALPHSSLFAPVFYTVPYFGPTCVLFYYLSLRVEVFFTESAPLMKKKNFLRCFSELSAIPSCRLQRNGCIDRRVHREMKNTLLFLLTMCILDVVSRRKTAQMRNQWMEQRKRTQAYFTFDTYGRKSCPESPHPVVNEWMHRQKSVSGNEEDIALPVLRNHDIVSRRYISSLAIEICVTIISHSGKRHTSLTDGWKKGSGHTHLLLLSADMQIRQRRELRLIRSAELLNGRVEEFKRRRRERSTSTH